LLAKGRVAISPNGPSQRPAGIPGRKSGFCYAAR
jgi:hypothetical protein